MYKYFHRNDIFAIGNVNTNNIVQVERKTKGIRIRQTFNRLLSCNIVREKK